MKEEGKLVDIFYIVCRLWCCDRWRIRGSGNWYAGPPPNKNAKKTIKYQYCNLHEEKESRM